jgi:hypothetical protein
MKKIIIAICMVVMSLVGAVAVPSGETWAETEYDINLKKAKEIEDDCTRAGTGWRDASSNGVECKSACAETSLSGTAQNGVRLTCDYKGVRIKEKLKLIIDIISVIIAALGVAAITYVGIMYLTAGPDVGKAVKARVRLIEIIIGLAVYALLYTILSFLIPNFN